MNASLRTAVWIALTLAGFVGGGCHAVAAPGPGTPDADGDKSPSPAAPQRPATTRPATTLPRVVVPDGMTARDYVVYDEAGTPVIKGVLILPQKLPVDPNQQVDGTWHAAYFAGDEMAPSAKLGPQTGEGACAGFVLDGGKLRLNLNPWMADNNVNVVFENVSAEKWVGSWSYSTFAGVTAKGKVEATAHKP